MRPFRNLKIGSVIEHELSTLFLKDMDFGIGVMVTITDVEVDPKLIEARVTLGVLPLEKGPEVYNMINEQRIAIQWKLSRILNIKPMPKLVFGLVKE